MSGWKLSYNTYNITRKLESYESYEVSCHEGILIENKGVKIELL